MIIRRVSKSSRVFSLIKSEASRFYAIDLAGPNLFEFPRRPWSYKFATATGGHLGRCRGFKLVAACRGHLARRKSDEFLGSVDQAYKPLFRNDILQSLVLK